MKKIHRFGWIRELCFGLIRITGIPFFFRKVIQKNKVTILLFHDIPVKKAEKFLSYLTRKYNIIGLNQYIDACITKSKNLIPKNALIITFDDGHNGNYQLLPLIKKFNINITIFICAGLVDTKRHFWFEENASSLTIEELNVLPNSKRLKLLSEYNFLPEKEYDHPQALNKKQILEMKDFVNFQSHTIFHPSLPGCGDEDAFREISNSKEILEKKYNLNINAIAYPNGDFSKRDIEYAKNAGYKCGLTIIPGLNDMFSDLFMLKRYCANDEGNLNELIVKTSGVWNIIRSSRTKKQIDC